MSCKSATRFESENNATTLQQERRPQGEDMLTRLIIAASALALAAPCMAGSTRTSRFEYDAQGQLIREIIEPDDSNLCLVKTYFPDVFGNRLTTTTRNCNGTVSNGVI